MKRHSYNIGGLIFHTKAALETHVRRILHGRELGEALVEEEFQFMLALLERHQQREEKFGVGVLAFGRHTVVPFTAVHVSWLQGA